MAQDDQVQHGIDDNPQGDAKKGAVLGGVGGAVVGLLAGGPVGAIVGAVAGAIGSGAGVAAVDRVDNDDTVTGLGAGGATTDDNTTSAGVAAPRRWEEVSPHYRQGWQQHYGQSGERWEEHEPAHRFAWETRSRPEYRGRSWSETEADLRQDWESRYPDRPWASAAPSIREGWESTGEVLRLHEEQLQVSKQPVQTGEVAVRKEVVTEQKTVEVPVTREEVVVERRPVQAGQAATSDIGEGGEIRIPVMEEQVTVQKTPVVTEEVAVSTRQVQDTQQVTDTVRREEARVDQQGDVNVQK